MRNSLHRYAFIFAFLPLINITLAALLYTNGGPLAPVIGITVISCIFPFQLLLAAKNSEFGTRTGPLKSNTNPRAYWVTVIVLSFFYLALTGLMVGLLYWQMSNLQNSNA
jgi:hypothetical protein